MYDEQNFLSLTHNAGCHLLGALDLRTTDGFEGSKTVTHCLLSYVHHWTETNVSIHGHHVPNMLSKERVKKHSGEIVFTIRQPQSRS